METHGHTLDKTIKKKLSNKELAQFNKIYYGTERHNEIEIQEASLNEARRHDFEVAAYSFEAKKEEIRPPRLVKIGLIQHSIVLPTDRPIKDQREAIFHKVKNIIDVAALEKVNILCLQETWSMPFFLCTKEKETWSGFAESAANGPSGKFLSQLAKKHEMVIICPILEKDEDGTWWNTAVVIDETGKVMGKHRKNHLPSIGSFSETSFYSPGDTGHPVFDTKYGKIAVNICYGRHQALNWTMFALNGAEIVFNPAATIADFGESFWGIEARNAAIANSYFTFSINRVGTEVFKSKDVSRSYYGSSYASAPNGIRTPSLSRVNDGLLIVQLDLNLIRQVKDEWGFRMTSRFELYAEELRRKVQQC